MITIPQGTPRWLHVMPDGDELWFDVEPSHVPTLMVWRQGNHEETLTRNGRVTVEDWPQLPRYRVSRIVRTRVRPYGGGWTFVA
jgi:hypothetical protein